MPDPAYRPSGAARLRLISSDVRIGRSGGTAALTFEAPAAASGECWVALRRERQVVWSQQVQPVREGQPGAGTERLRVECQVPALRFAPAGRYGLSLELGDLQWSGREEGDHAVAEVRLKTLSNPRPVVA